MASKQKLSPKAAKAKAIRDKACAMTPDRRAKKAHSQRVRRAAIKKGRNSQRVTINRYGITRIFR